MIKINDTQISYLRDILGDTYPSDEKRAQRAAFDVCAIMDFLLSTADVKEMAKDDNDWK